MQINLNIFLKKINNVFKKEKYYFIFSLIFSIIICWQLLLPGYIITLDWVGGPSTHIDIENIDSILNLPGNLILFILKTFLPNWFVQKIIFITIFFLLLYLPLKFFPFKKNNNEYFASLLFTFNPFVYERILAGQWRVVLGYTFIFPLFYFLYKFQKTRKKQNLYFAFLIVFLIGWFSIHFFVINIVLFILWFICFLLFAQKDKNHIYTVFKNIFYSTLVFLLSSSYWIFPFFFKKEVVTSKFDKLHLSAFGSCGTGNLDVMINILLLKGFWAECHKWSEQFKLLSYNNLLSFFVFLIIFLFIIFGILKILKKRDKKLFFIFIWFSMALIFSSGINSYFSFINQVFFDNISIWNGFRDSQKWSGVLAFVYSMLGAIGAGVLLETIKKNKIINIFALTLPILLMHQMLFGFNNQIKSVQYPKSWHDVNAILKQDDKCKALFLPWHQYYSLKFANDILAANTSKAFFDCEIISGKNTQLKNIGVIDSDIDKYKKLENRITSNNSDYKKLEETIDLFRKNGIKYIIYTSDYVDKDLYKYPFVRHPDLKIIYKSKDIVLYQIIK